MATGTATFRYKRNEEKDLPLKAKLSADRAEVPERSRYSVIPVRLAIS